MIKLINQQVNNKKERFVIENNIQGYSQIRYSLHIAPNVRLILEPNATQDTVMICTEIEVEGVSDYHGSKENWYIP